MHFLIRMCSSFSHLERLKLFKTHNVGRWSKEVKDANGLYIVATITSLKLHRILLVYWVLLFEFSKLLSLAYNSDQFAKYIMFK